MGNGSKLLINEHPLQVLPTLATLVGLNEAIFLQQLHYWLQNPKMGREYEGQRYIRNSFEEWQADNFPFWSVRTLKRVVTKLKADGLIRSTGRLNKMPIDRTQWYTIDYDILEGLVSDDDMATRKCQDVTFAKCQSGTMAKCQDDPSIVTEWHDTKGQVVTTNNQRLPETTTERGKTKSHRIATNPASSTKPNGQASLSKPLAVHVFRSVATRWPHRATWQMIDQTVGDKQDDLDFWENVVQQWIGCGWNPQNVNGMLDHFRDRRLPTTGKPEISNGHSPAADVTPELAEQLKRMEKEIGT